MAMAGGAGAEHGAYGVLIPNWLQQPRILVDGITIFRVAWGLGNTVKTYA